MRAYEGVFFCFQCLLLDLVLLLICLVSVGLLKSDEVAVGYSKVGPVNLDVSTDV